MKGFYLIVFSFLFQVYDSSSEAKGKTDRCSIVAELYRSFETDTRDMARNNLELMCAESDSLGVGLSSPGQRSLHCLGFLKD